MWFLGETEHLLMKMCVSPLFASSASKQMSDNSVINSLMEE